MSVLCPNNGITRACITSCEHSVKDRHQTADCFVIVSCCVVNNCERKISAIHSAQISGKGELCKDFSKYNVYNISMGESDLIA